MMDRYRLGILGLTLLLAACPGRDPLPVDSGVDQKSIPVTDSAPVPDQAQPPDAPASDTAPTQAYVKFTVKVAGGTSRDVLWTKANNYMRCKAGGPPSKSLVVDLAQSQSQSDPIEMIRIVLNGYTGDQTYYPYYCASPNCGPPPWDQLETASYYPPNSTDTYSMDKSKYGCVLVVAGADSKTIRGKLNCTDLINYTTNNKATLVAELSCPLE
jgi:hypothetical protein